MGIASRQTVLIIDGGSQDRVAILEAARVIGDDATRPRVFVVPVRVGDRVHLEAGGEPNRLRRLIVSTWSALLRRRLVRQAGVPYRSAPLDRTRSRLALASVVCANSYPISNQER